MYAYEINKNINKTFQTNESTVYINLKKMVENDYLIWYQQNNIQNISRKYYQITKQGITRLFELEKEWNNFYEIVNDLLNNLSKEG